MVRTWYMTMLVPSEKPLSRIWHLNFAETKKSHQYFNHDHDETHIMTMIKLISTMIKHTKKKNWLAPSFSFLEIATQKECFFQFIWVLKVSLRLTLIQKEGLCPLRLLPLIQFPVCDPSRYSTREQLARVALFWRTTKLYAKWRWGKWRQK